jgi:polyisoprenoid-binding protein YceI
MAVVSAIASRVASPLVDAFTGRDAPRRKGATVRKTAIIATALIVAALAGIRPAASDPITFQIDRAHTEVGFDIRHFFNKVHGKFTDFNGTIVYDPKNLAVSTVEVTIRDTSIFTANERRDNHLRTQDFFWVEKYPLITFKSTKIIPGKDDKHFQVVGDLTMRGVTKSVTLETEFLGMAPTSIGGNDLGIQAGWVGTVTIPDRKEYGLNWNKTLDQGGTMLSDDVQLTLNVAAFAKNPNAPPASNAPPQPKPATTKG